MKEYKIGDTVQVYLEMPYDQGFWEYGTVIGSTDKFVTVKLNHPHRRFPKGQVRKLKESVRHI